MYKKLKQLIMPYTINTTSNQEIIKLINKILKTNKKDFDLSYRSWDDTYSVRFLGQKKVRGYLKVENNKASFINA